MHKVHILRSIVQNDEHITSFVLSKMGGHQKNLTRALDVNIESYPKVSGIYPSFSNGTN